MSEGKRPGEDESQENLTKRPDATRDGAIASPFAKHPDERSAEMLFAFTARRPETSTKPPQIDEAATWDRTSLKTYNGHLAVALMSVVALAPIPLGSNRPVYWLILAAVLFAILGIYLGALARRNIRMRKPIWRVPLVGGLAVLFLLYGVFQTLPVGTWLPGLMTGNDGSPMISLSRDATRLATLRWASYAVFFFLMLQVVDNRTRARRLAWVIFLIVSAHAAFALISFRFLGDAFFWGPKDAYRTVVTGTFVNRNSFATFAGAGAILGFSLLLHDYLRRRDFPRRLSWAVSIEGVKSATSWIFLVIILAALVATGSRMGVAATGTGLILVSILSMRKRMRHSTRTLLILVAGGTAALVAVFVVFGQVTLDRSIFSASDGNSRLDLYAQVLDIIRARPISGFGLDAFSLAFEQVHRPPVSPDLVWGRAHSTYLTLWAEMGLIFGSIPLLIVAILAFRMLRTIVSKHRDYVLAIAGLGVVTQVALHSLVDFSLEMPANVYLFLAILAVAATGRHRAAPEAGAIDGQQ